MLPVEPVCVYCGDADRLFDTYQAAAYLNVEANSPKDRYIRRLIAEQRIAYHKIGKFVRLKKRDLDEFRDGGRVEPRSW